VVEPLYQVDLDWRNGYHTLVPGSQMPEGKRLLYAANARWGVGGQGQNLAHVVEALRHDFRVEVFDQGRAAGSYLSKWINRTPYLRRRKDWSTLLADIAFDHSALKRLDDAKVFAGAVGQCAVSARAARERGIPVVLDVVNTHIDDFAGRAESECRKLGVRSFMHPCMQERIYAEYESATVIRVMSHVAKRTFVARGVLADKVVVATPPVDVAQFPRARFDDKVFRVIFVGLLEPWKGFHHLLQAWEELKLPDAELVLWGGPSSRAVSKLLWRHQQAQPNVLVRPVPVRQAGLDAVFGKASVLVHPSLADGFGYSVAEGMASGLPVILTENTGAADVVVDGESGFVIPTQGVSALKERLAFLHQHRDRLPVMGSAARRAIARLTPESFRQALVSGIRSRC
jgi:glycosyltransferase involved in cell wall biosynthesis